MRKFNSRGHYCNYCRKIVNNKVAGKYQERVILANQAMHCAWESGRAQDYINDLSNLVVTPTFNEFHEQLQMIYLKYI